jgi:hypothetical protein
MTRVLITGDRRRCLAAGIPTWHIDPSGGDETPRQLREAPDG